MTSPLASRFDGLVRAGLAALALIAVSLAATPASATRIQKVTSPKGIEAWLVEEHAIPLVAFQFSFLGGSTQDPQGKEGLANLVSSLIDEGAGDLDSQAFQTRLEELAVEMHFSDDRDRFNGSMKTLSEHTDAAVDLLAMALARPRFEAEAIERMRVQTIAGLRRSAKNPESVAGRLWSATVFPGHPYGRAAEGTEATVGAIVRADVVDFHQRVFTRKGLKISVVGDIDAARLGPMLDRMFGDLPAEGRLTEVAKVEAATGRTASAVLAVPQATIQFGGVGILRADPDFIPAYVMNHILGGGGFSAWLHTEVREKRGLAYSIGTGLSAYAKGAAFVGSVGTSADKVEETLALIRTEIARMRDTGPSAEELAAAKAFLIGSYPLRFDTSEKIAGALLAMQVDDLGIDYIDKRNGLIEAVTLDDVKRVAKRLFSEPLDVVVVGPEAKK